MAEDVKQKIENRSIAAHSFFVRRPIAHRVSSIRRVLRVEFDWVLRFQLSTSTVFHTLLGDG